MVRFSALRVPHEEGTRPRTSIAAPSCSRVHEPALGPTPAAAHRPAIRTRRPNRVSTSSAWRMCTRGAWPGRTGTPRASGRPPGPSLPGRARGTPEAAGPGPGSATGVGFPGLRAAPPRELQATRGMVRRRNMRLRHTSRLPLHEVHENELAESHGIGEVRFPLAYGSDLLHEIHQAAVASQHEGVDHNS